MKESDGTVAQVTFNFEFHEIWVVWLPRKSKENEREREERKF